jgi:hypothetical protein
MKIHIRIERSIRWPSLNSNWLEFRPYVSCVVTAITPLAPVYLSRYPRFASTHQYILRWWLSLKVRACSKTWFGYYYGFCLQLPFFSRYHHWKSSHSIIFCGNFWVVPHKFRCISNVLSFKSPALSRLWFGEWLAVTIFFAWFLLDWFFGPSISHRFLKASRLAFPQDTQES